MPDCHWLPAVVQGCHVTVGSSSKKKLQSHDSLDSSTIHEAAEKGASKDIAR